jgi:hypothetical protein
MAAKTKSGIKTGYFYRRDCSDFIIKWLESLIEVAGEVTKDNMYDCVNYTIENIPTSFLFWVSTQQDSI